MSKIKFEVTDSLLNTNNSFKMAKIRYQESDIDDYTNPIPLIMAMLACSKAKSTVKGFPYSFPLIFN